MVFSGYMPSSGIAGSYDSFIFSFLRNLMWMKLESVIQSEVKSEREKQISYTNAYMWNLEKWYRRTYLQGRNRDVDVENGHVDRGRKGRVG